MTDQDPGELFVLVDGLAYPHAMWERAFQDASLEYFDKVLPRDTTPRQAMRVIRQAQTPQAFKAVMRASISKLLERAQGIALASACMRGTIAAVLPVDKADAPR